MLLALQYMTISLLTGLVTNMQMMFTSLQACEHHLTDEKDNVQYNYMRAGTLHRRGTCPLKKQFCWHLCYWCFENLDTIFVGSC